MAVINDPNTALNIVAVGERATSSTGAGHVVSKPIPTSVGHYRVTHRFAIIAAQVATARLFEIRCASATNLLVPTRLRIAWIQTAAHTAAIEDSLDVYYASGFSVVDTTNTVTPVPRATRTSFGATTVQVRGVTVAGAAAGMTGGTVTLDANGPTLQVPQWLLLAQPTAGTVNVQRLDYQWNTSDGEYPFVLVQNEGIVIANRVLLGAAAGSSVYVDLSYAETTAY